MPQSPWASPAPQPSTHPATSPLPLTVVIVPSLLVRALDSTYLGQKLESKHPASDASVRATVGGQILITGLASPAPSSIPLCMLGSNFPALHLLCDFLRPG